MNKQKKLNNMALTPLALGVMLAMQVEAAPMVLIGDNVSIDDADNAGTNVGAGNIFDDDAGNQNNANKISIEASGGVDITGNTAVTGTLSSSDQLTVTIGGATITGDTTISGALNAGTNGTEFGVDGAGAVTATGVDAGAGGITAGSGNFSVDAGTGKVTAVGVDAGAGGLETTGRITAGSGKFSVDATTGKVTAAGIDAGAVDITNAGAITGATNITAANTITANELTTGTGGVSIVGGDITGVDSMVVNDLTVSGTFTRSTTSADAIDTVSNTRITNVVGTLVNNDLQDDGTVTFSNLISGAGMSIENTSASMVVRDSNMESSVALRSDTASVGVTNTQTDQFKGLTVTDQLTTISGGTQTTTLEMDDDGARFSSTLGSGGNAKVSGIADGVNANDAVNRGQLNTAYAGVASVAALAALPQPSPGRHFAVGVGTSYYQGESGVAVGLKGSLTDTTQFTLGGSWNSSGDGLVNGGVGMSW